MSADSESPSSAAEPRVYDLGFVFCYLANTTLMTAVSVLFRYSDFVIEYLGGTEFQLGLIVGVGMVGALAMRLLQGQGIDRYGPRAIWLASLALFVVSALLHLTIRTVDGPMIYVLRVVWTVSTAGAFGASISFISLRVPETRIAEVVGILGTSGFLGLAIGPTLGDLMFGGEPVTVSEVQRMFLVSGGMAASSLVFACFSGRSRAARHEPRRPPLMWILRRYHPGPLMPVAAAMGLAVVLPHTFLRAYTVHLGIPDIKTFFLVYAATAFIVRVNTSRLTARIGFRPVIVTGLFAAAIGMLLYLVVRNEWLLAVPAMAAGVAHALLFPAVMAAGSISFPSRYRGVATTLVLGMFDVGVLVGQPAVGAILDWTASFGWPSYSIMFSCVAVVLFVVAGYYYVAARVPRGRTIRTTGAQSARIAWQDPPHRGMPPEVVGQAEEIHPLPMNSDAASESKAAGPCR